MQYPAPQQCGSCKHKIRQCSWLRDVLCHEHLLAIAEHADLIEIFRVKTRGFGPASDKQFARCIQIKIISVGKRDVFFQNAGGRVEPHDLERETGMPEFGDKKIIRRRVILDAANVVKEIVIAHERNRADKGPGVGDLIDLRIRGDKQISVRQGLGVDYPNPYCEEEDLILPANETGEWCPSCNAEFEYNPEDYKCYWVDRPVEVYCNQCKRALLMIQGSGNYECWSCGRVTRFKQNGANVWII